MSKLIKTDNEYKYWFTGLKQRIRQSQIKAAIKVNTKLIRMYWELGKDIVEKQSDSKWGSGFFKELSQDLKEEFPEMEGFSPTNLKYMKRMYSFYCQGDTNRQQVADDLQQLLFSIPWWHHIIIITKCKSKTEAFFYIKKIIELGWSRNILINYIQVNLYLSEGKVISNFANRLPSPQSDLAQQTLKDPYNFDFLTMRKGYLERELESALTENITKFLLELGSGFAYVGKEVRIQVGEKEIMARYTLETTTEPIGISEYQWAEFFPKDFKSSLPSIEEIENELR